MYKLVAPSLGMFTTPAGLVLIGLPTDVETQDVSKVIFIAEEEVAGALLEQGFTVYTEETEDAAVPADAPAKTKK